MTTTLLLCIISGLSVLLVVILLVLVLYYYNYAKKQKLTARDDNVHKDQAEWQESLARFQNEVKFTLTAIKENNKETLEDIAGKTTTSQNLSQASFSKIDDMSKTVSRLFDSSSTKGHFGEWQLQAIVKTLLGDNASLWCAQKTIKQVGSAKKVKPDMTIYGGKGIPNLYIDSKFPVQPYDDYIKTKERYQDSAHQTGKQQLSLVEKTLKTSFKKHITDIAKKYLITTKEQTSAFCVLMFVPSDQIFVTISRLFHDLLQFAFQQQVILVGPTLLSYYLIQIKEWQKLLMAINKNQALIELIHKYNKFLFKFEAGLEDVLKRQQTLNNDLKKLSETTWQKFRKSANKLLEQKA